ncbi:MAG: coenzyme F420-0:L-glutamate ligase [Deltaproteobacteria bacterium]|nr:coenzyme F420-0:L-glutamate ligase [Deltaproteobacteria bacterium]
MQDNASAGSVPRPALGVYPLPGLPEVRPGDDLPALLAEALVAAGLVLRDDDVLVVAQKAVSKAEGSRVALAEVKPTPAAVRLAGEYGRDARLVELVLRESRRVVRMQAGLMICETRHGFICANAGVDSSNAGAAEMAVLLPEDPDRSAGLIRAGLHGLTGAAPGVIVADTFGRPWRAGLTQVALGVAGVAPLADYAGEQDDTGRPLRATVVAVADELAGAAGLVCGKLDRVPAALVRGYLPPGRAGKGAAPRGSSGRDLLRDRLHDLFR